VCLKNAKDLLLHNIPYIFGVVIICQEKSFYHEKKTWQKRLKFELYLLSLFENFPFIVA